jgi:hypothetical protein
MCENFSELCRQESDPATVGLIHPQGRLDLHMIAADAMTNQARAGAQNR